MKNTNISSLNNAWLKFDQKQYSVILLHYFHKDLIVDMS